jgi:tetratricopeptide (TPR) repeat protein
MSIITALLLGSIAFYLLYYQDLAERQLATTAEEHYKQGNYKEAAKAYSQLVEEYPSSADHDKYRFFADLSELQGAVRALTNREDYTAALERWQQFVAAQKDSPWAKPGSGYGHDIHEAGKKLCEDMVAYADEQLTKFRSDRSGQAALEEKVRLTVQAGKDLLKSLEPFRAADDPPLDKWQQEWERLEGELRKEQSRRQALAKARDYLTTITDARIATAENELAAAGWLADPEAQALLNEARTRLRAMIRYELDPAAPQEPPLSAVRTIYCTAALTPASSTAAPTNSDVPPTVFPVVARGILYALEEESGTLLWAVRVGADVTFPPTLARLTLPEGISDVLLCAHHAERHYGVAAYLLRSGSLRWYQPLPAPLVGPPVVIGSRVYVPLRDEWGTIYEFDAIDGARRGRIRLGQPIAHLTVEPKGRYLYATAEARRIFVLDGNARDEEDNLLSLRCLQVLHTGHGPGTVRVPPLVLEVAAVPPAASEQRLLLCQTDGARSTKLRMFRLPPLEMARPADTPPPEIQPTAVEYPLEGWVNFPPVSDGERLAIATDAGRLRLFTLNPAGSPDPPLSALPDRLALHSTAESSTLPLPAAVMGAEEGAFVVLAQAALQKYRLGLHPQRGLDIVPVHPPRLIGVPLHEPLVRPQRQTACLALRWVDPPACQAALVQLSDGAIRWRRQLGVAHAMSPIVQGEVVLLLGQDGSVFALHHNLLNNPSVTLMAGADQLLAPIPSNSVGATEIVTSLDKSLVATVTPYEEVQRDRRQLRLLIRLIRDGKVWHEGHVTPAAPLAGRPIFLDETLLLPLADGLIYRHIRGKGLASPDRLEAGPSWRIERREGTTTTALLGALSADSFISNDGSRTLKRWLWPADQRWSDAGEWVLRDRPAVPPLPLIKKEGSASHFLVADTSGNIWMYAADRIESPQRRWRPGTVLPLGQPTSPMNNATDTQGRLRVTYTVENRLVVCLDPQQDAPLWVYRPGEDQPASLVGPPLPLPNGDWVVVDLLGRLTRLQGTTGQAIATSHLHLPGIFPVAAPCLTPGQDILLPLSDGSFVLHAVPDPPNKTPTP